MKHLKIYEEVSNLEGNKPEALLTFDTETNPGLLKFVNNKPSIMKGTWKTVYLKEIFDRMYLFILTSGKISVAILAPVSDVGDDVPLKGVFKIDKSMSNFGEWTCGFYK